MTIHETYNMNSAYFHELYFANIGDSNSRINMDSLSYMRLNRDFGTFDDWLIHCISLLYHSLVFSNSILKRNLAKFYLNLSCNFQRVISSAWNYQGLEWPDSDQVLH